MLPLCIPGICSNIPQIFTQCLPCVRHYIGNTIYLVIRERNFYISLTPPSAPPCTSSCVLSSMNVILMYLMYFSTASLPLYTLTHWFIHLVFISVHWNNTMFLSALPDSNFFLSLFPTHGSFLFSMSYTADLCMSLLCLRNLNGSPVTVG